jgi:alkylation response protein AidB-like acyl-CoA dehydrogenase
MAKLAASRVAEKRGVAVHQLVRRRGHDQRAFAVEKYFRDCKIGQIYEGSKQHSAEHDRQVDQEGV